MKRTTRMLLMSGGSRNGDLRNGERRSYDSPRNNYDGGAYDRFRDDRSREHYDNGRYAPMRNDGGSYVESRFRDRDGREHYDNGRFAPMRSEYNAGAYDHYGPEMHYPSPMTPYVPPVYQERGGRPGGQRSSGYARPMNKIGFSLTGEADHIPDEFGQEYRSTVNHNRMNEMEYRKGGERMAGYSMGGGYIPFTREIAEEWTSHMENEDGSKGPHWSMEQTKQVQAQRGIECDPLEFWVAMNMIYSDYCKAAKKANANTIDFYADMAKSFLDDKDAPQDKLARYYFYIADAKE